MVGLPEGQHDCIGQAVSLASTFGGMRVMFGTLLVYCRDDLQDPSP